MSKSVRRVQAALAAAGEVAHIRDLGDCRTAADAAAAVGCALDQIVKSIIFRGKDSGACLLFLTAGGNRIDPDRAGAIAGEPLGKADAGQVRAETGFAIGGVAPIGHLQPIRSFWDPRLDDFDEVWAAAGTPRHVLALAPGRLRALAGAEPARFTA